MELIDDDRRGVSHAPTGVRQVAGMVAGDDSSIGARHLARIDIRPASRHICPIDFGYEPAILERCFDRSAGLITAPQPQPATSARAPA